MKKKTKTGPKTVQLKAIVPAPLPSDAEKAMTSARSLVARASLIMVTPKTMNDATLMLSTLKAMRETVEEKRDWVVQPLKAHVKRLEGLFKPTLDELKQVDQQLRQRVLYCRQEEQNRLESERAMLVEAAGIAQEGGDDDKALELATKAVNTAPLSKQLAVEGGGTVQVSKVWDFEVEDLGAVPVEYLSLDATKVRSAIRAGVTQVPGLRIFQRDQLAVKL